MMKKMMIAVAAMTAGIAMADVTSANVVGYQSQGMTLNNYTMFAVPFQHVSDTNGLMLNKDLTVENVTGGNLYSKADQIWIWVPAKNTYDIFFYSTKSGENFWKMKGGEAKAFEECTDYKKGLKEGSALYFLAHKDGTTAKTITYSGQVENEPEVEIKDIALNNYTMVANPYPTALFLNNAEQFEVTNLTGGNLYSKADQIWVWVPSKNTYDIFFYSTKSGENFWKMKGGDAKAFEECTNYRNGLPAGAAFYFLAHKDGTEAKSLIFKKGF